VSARVFTVTVFGAPQTKGSGKAVISKSTGRAIYKPSNPKTATWQTAIGQTAAAELLRTENRACRLMQGALYLEVAFYLPRPKALLTKSKAPLAFDHTKKPDLDKLLRAAKDALTGIVWTDDSQVVHVVGRKKYCAAGEFPRAVIQVRDALKESKESA
jgi:crossover junction endodeoxyribonuclease RusA